MGSGQRRVGRVTPQGGRGFNPLTRHHFNHLLDRGIAVWTMAVISVDKVHAVLGGEQLPRDLPTLTLPGAAPGRRRDRGTAAACRDGRR
jgi:hypothetical protein